MSEEFYIGDEFSTIGEKPRAVFHGTPEQRDVMLAWIRAEQGVANAERRFREAEADLAEYGMSWHPDRGFSTGGGWWYLP